MAKPKTKFRATGIVASVLPSVCVLAVAATGCGISHAGASDVVATSRPTDMSEIHLPLDAYALTDAQATQQTTITYLLQRACMRKFGFNFLTELSTGRTKLAMKITQEFNSRRYGVTDPIAVKSFGYHLPAWTAGNAKPAATRRLPEDEAIVLNGHAKGLSAGPVSFHNQPIPPNGCAGEVDREETKAGLPPSSGSASGLVARLRTEAFQRAQADPRILAVFGKWSHCMKSRGYSYADPFKAVGDPGWDFRTSVASQKEIATAEADLSCKSATNLLGVESTVESDYQNIAIEKNSAALSGTKKDVEIRAKNLKRLADSYGA